MGVLNSFLFMDNNRLSLFLFFVPLFAYIIHHFILGLVRTISSKLYEPVESLTPIYAPEDVTVVAIVNDEDDLEEFTEALASWSSCHPKEILVSTTENLLEKVSSICMSSTTDTRVIPAEDFSIPEQLMSMLNVSLTSIIAITHTNTIWKSKFLKLMIAGFKGNGTVTAVCTSPVATLDGSIPSLLADIVLSVHKAELAASSNFDGGLDVLPGNTTLVKAKMLQSTSFQSALKTHRNIDSIRELNEFLWDWILSNNMDIVYQGHKDAQTPRKFRSVEDVLKLVVTNAQCLCRYEIRGVLKSRFVWRRFPWLAVKMVFRLLRALSMVYFTVVLMYLTIVTPSWSWQQALLVSFAQAFVGSAITMIDCWLQNPLGLALLPAYFMIDILHATAETFWVLFAMVQLPFSAFKAPKSKKHSAQHRLGVGIPLSAFDDSLQSVVTESEFDNSHIETRAFPSFSQFPDSLDITTGYSGSPTSELPPSTETPSGQSLVSGLSRSPAPATPSTLSLSSTGTVLKNAPPRLGVRFNIPRTNSSFPRKVAFAA